MQYEPHNFEFTSLFSQLSYDIGLGSSFGRT